MLVSALDGWNDGESDAEYCDRLFGENFEWLMPDEFIDDNRQTETLKIFYLLWTPLTQHLKVGKSDNEQNLLLRLQERRRQCGETQILGIKYLFNPTQEEKWWKTTLKGEWVGSNNKTINPQIATEVFDFSFIDYPLSYISKIAKERDVYINMRNLEPLVKELIDWDGNYDNIPLLCDLR